MAGWTLCWNKGGMWADVERKCWDMVCARRCTSRTNQTCQEQSASLWHTQLLTHRFLYDTLNYQSRTSALPKGDTGITTEDDSEEGRGFLLLELVFTLFCSTSALDALDSPLASSNCYLYISVLRKPHNTEPHINSTCSYLTPDAQRTKF